MFCVAVSACVLTSRRDAEETKYHCLDDQPKGAGGVDHTRREARPIPPSLTLSRDRLVCLADAVMRVPVCFLPFLAFSFSSPPLLLLFVRLSLIGTCSLLGATPLLPDAYTRRPNNNITQKKITWQAGKEKKKLKDGIF